MAQEITFDDLPSGYKAELSIWKDDRRPQMVQVKVSVSRVRSKFIELPEGCKPVTRQEKVNEAAWSLIKDFEYNR